VFVSIRNTAAVKCGGEQASVWTPDKSTATRFAAVILFASMKVAVPLVLP